MISIQGSVRLLGPAESGQGALERPDGRTDHSAVFRVHCRSGKALPKFSTTSLAKEVRSLEQATE